MAEARVAQARAAVDGAKHEHQRTEQVYNDGIKWLRDPRRLSQLSDEKWEKYREEVHMGYG